MSERVMKMGKLVKTSGTQRNRGTKATVQWVRERLRLF